MRNRDRGLIKGVRRFNGDDGRDTNSEAAVTVLEPPPRLSTERWRAATTPPSPHLPLCCPDQPRGLDVDLRMATTIEDWLRPITPKYATEDAMRFRASERTFSSTVPLSTTHPREDLGAKTPRWISHRFL